MKAMRVLGEDPATLMRRARLDLEGQLAGERCNSDEHDPVEDALALLLIAKLLEAEAVAQLLRRPTITETVTRLRLATAQ